MKTILLVMVFLVITISAFNQSENTDKLLKEIEGRWQVDDNGYVTYQVVIDSLSSDKKSLYNKAMDYFVYNYNDANSVIQNRDAENGIIIGKGIFKKVYILEAILIRNIIDTWHILKVEVKDDRARLTISLTQYDETVTGGDSDDHYSYPITKQYPINPRGTQKNLYGKAFYYSHMKAIETLFYVERALRGESTTKKNDNW